MSGQSRQSGRGIATVFKTISVLLAVVLAGFLLLAGNVVASARSYDSSSTDAIVVLGAAQYWSEPSPVFSNRLDHAIELHRQAVAPKIVTVGGGWSGDKTTEAEAGAAYLRKHGVPKSDVVAIPRGADTIESMEALASLARENGWESVTVVSDRAHVARAAAVAGGLGLETKTSGPADGDGSLLSFGRVARESLGLARFYVWDRWHLEAS